MLEKKTPAVYKSSFQSFTAQLAPTEENLLPLSF
jgi:hypothetical protein